VPAGKKTLPVSRAIGDYVFGLAPEAKPAFPTIGLAFKKVENMENLVIDAKPTDGAASRADFDKGDVVLSVDGKAYTDINELRMELAKLCCGGEVKFKVLRAGAVKDVSLKCEKAAAAEPAEKKSPELIFGPGLEARLPPLKTPAEETSYREYTQNEAIAAFLSVLDRASAETAVSIVGRSLATDEYGARDIFLVVLSKNGAAAPGSLDRTKPTVLFTAAQHGNEQSAKEAVLQIIRDLAVGDLRPLLDKVNVLAIPQTNPYGNFMIRANGRPRHEPRPCQLEAEVSSHPSRLQGFARRRRSVTRRKMIITGLDLPRSNVNIGRTSRTSCGPSQLRSEEPERRTHLPNTSSPGPRRGHSGAVWRGPADRGER
jgi:hypothetical protein